MISRHTSSTARQYKLFQPVRFEGLGMRTMRWLELRLSTFLPCISLVLTAGPLTNTGSAAYGQQKPGTENRFDGPAELPRMYIKSSLADTPAPGHVRLVKRGDDLQEALDKAQCGDTLKLEAGATFRGPVVFPHKGCDDSHWIVVRTSAPDESLPPEGTRITPCYAGVPSLPGRPDFHCTLVRNVMAKIEFEAKAGSGPLRFAAGANHYRIIGVEITRGSPGANITALAFAKDDDTTDHLIFDRVWVHGTAQDETTRGIALRGMTYAAVVDSFLNDFHCIAAVGTCTDSQTVSNGGYNTPGGPYKIVNNFLEAAGENILFGGGPATQIPSDIEIRHNYLFKPMIWKQGEPGFVGGPDGHPFIVKNNFELKNGQRVLLEGNVLENSWGGFTQTGFAILLTPKNQTARGNTNVCPICRVSDVTIRYNRITNVGAVLQIANAHSDAGGVSSGGERYSIHDLVVDNVHSKDYRGFGSFLMLISVAPPLHDVQISHVTAFVPGPLITILHPGQEGIENFTLTDSILSTAAERPSVLSAGGGPQNCAFQPQIQGPAGVFKSCLANGKITHNIIIGSKEKWPPGNTNVADAQAAGLVGSRAGETSFRLCRAADEKSSCKKPSAAVGAATDGKDIGADMDAIDKATSGVL
jgi:hypothetical protein